MSQGYRMLAACRGAVCLLLLIGCGARNGLEPWDEPADPIPEPPDAPDGPADRGAGGRGTEADRCAGGSPNRDLPVPLLHYPFDGDARNVGALGPGYSGVDVSVTYAQGKIDEAASIGFPTWIELPGTAEVLEQADALTIAMWIEPDFSRATYPLIDCRSFYEGFHTYHGVYDDRRLTTCYGAGHPANGPGGCASFEVPTEGWHHLLYRYPFKGAAVEMYLDNQRIATLQDEPFDMFAAGVNDIWLGYRHEGDGWDSTLHRIDDLRVYDRVFELREQCEQVLGGRYCDGLCVLP